MNRTRMSIAVVLAMVLIVGVSFAASQGPLGSHRGGGPMFLSKLVQHNMMVQVLSDLSKQPADTIEQQLKDQHLPAVLSTYNIDLKVFQDAMRAKVADLISLLASKGYITDEQASKIQAKMAQFAQRRQAATDLVNSLVSSKAITPEQAQILLPRHH